MIDSYPTLEKAERKTYPAYGECIYCGSKEHLTDEHIIPFGLSGTLVLPKSSCQDCNKITSRFEREVLRGEMRSVRVYRALSSRRKHKTAPLKYPLVIVRGGAEMEVELDRNEYPILLPFVEFPPPRLISGEPSKEGIDVKGVVTLSFGPNPEEVMKKLSATQINPSVRTHPVPFARMLAKIGYAMAAATRALETLEQRSPLCDVILGTNRRIGDYVGTLMVPLSKHADQLHRVVVVADKKAGQLVADIQLFSDSPAPRYGVFLGKLSDTNAS